MKIFVGISLKWLIRVLLILFYGVTGYLQLFGYAPVLEWLWHEHVYVWTVLVVFTTVMFVPIGRSKREIILQNPEREKRKDQKRR